MVFELLAWDVNCPQHIPQKFEAAEVEHALQQRDARIQELEQEISLLRATYR